MVSCIVQSNPFNKDTEAGIESVRIDRVPGRIKRVEFRKNVRAFFPQGHSKLSLLSGYPIKRGLTVFVQCFDLRAQFVIRLVCSEFLMEGSGTIVCSRDERAVT